ncbi:hypothetical protein [Pseudomonas izuensis]|uniref:hypothetical protein n=1 Tax=Pseudomonas izuensis TaxID=2684212 RepID=UPI00135B5C56|nr:hypothetical protein [Pseudomonas izuensis]
MRDDDAYNRAGYGKVCVAPGVTLSFQRFIRPATDMIEHTPTSLGALPVAIDSQGVLILPLADDESFWIGLMVYQAPESILVEVAAEIEGGETVDVLCASPWHPDRHCTTNLLETPRIAGIRRSDGKLDVFSRQTLNDGRRPCVRLRFYLRRTPSDKSEGESVDTDWHITLLRLVSYATFEAETGLPEPAPLDPTAGYQGWRLP